MYVNRIRLRAHISVFVFIVMQFHNSAWAIQVKEMVLLLIKYIGLLQEGDPESIPLTPPLMLLLFSFHA